ncbi:hypothetical protein P7K49_025608 [Saguinus oedipus]|uniref:Uncharacterized protein n=1 Tax=Saguinus oedipus TaxID=9490 RepID=A0ABQ9UHL9_SAGOE|nr:hypothetical protein P7K49_025608 [Saguinus oedipus]
MIGREAADEPDEGRAQSRFRLGGACARELSRWVGCGHRILCCGSYEERPELAGDPGALGRRSSSHALWEGG